MFRHDYRMVIIFASVFMTLSGVDVFLELFVVNSKA